jgi:hypothetical protein
MTTTPTNNPISSSKLDRRIAVAPMMDWSGEFHLVFQVSDLPGEKIASA